MKLYLISFRLIRLSCLDGVSPFNLNPLYFHSQTSFWLLGSIILEFDQVRNRVFQSDILISWETSFHCMLMVHTFGNHLHFRLSREPRVSTVRRRMPVAVWNTMGVLSKLSEYSRNWVSVSIPMVAERGRLLRGNCVTMCRWFVLMLWP